MTHAQIRSFLAGIEKSSGKSGCWLWRGAVNGNGYGSAGRGCLAHRLAYELMVGPVPPGLHLDHLCRERLCVNPHHLEPVTASVNRRRTVEFGAFQLRVYCKRGHGLTKRNTWVDRTGQAWCKDCRRERRALAA